MAEHKYCRLLDFHQEKNSNSLIWNRMSSFIQDVVECTHITAVAVDKLAL